MILRHEMRGERLAMVPKFVVILFTCLGLSVDTVGIVANGGGTSGTTKVSCLFP